MEKNNEFQIKADQIVRLYSKKEYGKAARIADTIDWGKTREVPLLTKVADIYERTGRYKDCYEILNIAYDNSIKGKMIVYKMTEVAVKLGEFDEAASLYKEFVKIAPNDLERYELKYLIYKARGASLEDQIAILEEYKSRENIEKWAYELATLYYQQGSYSKCVEACDDLILWFGKGEYVTKAIELKMKIQPLTASQEESYREMVLEGKADEIEVKPINTDLYNTANLQEALAEGIKDYINDDTGGADAGEGAAPRYTTRNTDVSLPDIAAILEKTGKIELPEEYRDNGPKEQSDENKPAEGPQIITGGVDKETAKLPRFLGENDTGQLTFDMEENVYDRQITGQLSIEDILKDWEEKKKETEAAIAEAAVREEKKREERKRLRETGQLPDPMAELQETVPEEIKRLIEEIEERIPVKIHVEPLDAAKDEERVLEEDSNEAAEQGENGTGGLTDVFDILEGKTAEEPVELFDILEEPAAAEAEAGDAEAEAGDTEAEVEAGLADAVAEMMSQETEEEEKGEPTETEDKENEDEEDGKAVEGGQEASKTDTAGVTPMIRDLEKSLEDAISALPPGQLTEEQKKLFAYFTSVRGMNQQLAALLEENAAAGPRKDHSFTGNIVVTGKRGSGKTTLAVDIVKALQKQRGVKNPKLLKLTAEELDGKDITRVVEKLGGGTLLVERAGNMKTVTAVNLSRAMTQNTGGMLVILEDEKTEIDELFKRCESLGDKFKRTIDLPVFTNKELVAFGESYAEENNCVLDEMAMLALYNNIGRRQTSDHLVNVAEVKEMIDEAIAKGGKKGLFGKTKKSRLDDDGKTILLEKDFEE